MPTAFMQQHINTKEKQLINYFNKSEFGYFLASQTERQTFSVNTRTLNALHTGVHVSISVDSVTSQSVTHITSKTNHECD